ncbi:MAG: DUF2911 domain-containing protein [Cyclobacteriaceae bacterium]|nr:MAG: DUF2911 domain-containing protein [Cyclobacteriaceae bacterium]
MRLIIYLVSFVILFSACQSKKESSENHEHHAVSPGTAEADTVKKSLPKETHAMIGDAHITIKYTAPVTKGRVIWGGLVPYNEVWVTGAHRATSFEINQAFNINGQSVPAGKYAIFTIPGEEKWIFILNKNWDQHLADDYNASEDVLRFEVTPERLAENQERLLYAIENISDSEANLQISWEKIRITIPLKF